MISDRTLRHIRVYGAIAFVPLTKGHEALIDARNVSLVEGFNWSAKVDLRQDGSVRNVYAHRQSKTGVVHMHRIIAGAHAGQFVDHMDGDGLNNLSANLRICSHAQNLRNQSISADNTSGYKGVWFHKKSSKWAAAIQIDGTRKHLGIFENIEDAARAYASASEAFHGEYGRTS